MMYMFQKNTKNWYAIDALGAILPILTVLILGISQNISKISHSISNISKISQQISKLPQKISKYL